MVLQGLLNVICYLDDIHKTGHSVEEHLHNVEYVFARLQKYGIRAKQAKRSFVYPSVEYLGHRLDANASRWKLSWKQLHLESFKNRDPFWD